MIKKLVFVFFGNRYRNIAFDPELLIIIGTKYEVCHRIVISLAAPPILFCSAQRTTGRRGHEVEE